MPLKNTPGKNNAMISENDKRSIRRHYELTKSDVKGIVEDTGVSIEEFYKVHKNTFKEAKKKKSDALKKQRLVNNRDRQRNARSLVKFLRETMDTTNDAVSKTKAPADTPQKFFVTAKFVMEHTNDDRKYIQEQTYMFDIITSREYLKKDVKKRLTDMFTIDESDERRRPLFDNDLQPLSIQVTKAEVIDKKMNIRKMRMKDAAPLNYGFIEGVDEISLEHTDMQCVYKALHKRYGAIKSRALTENDWYRKFNQYYKINCVDEDDEEAMENNNLDKKSGVDTDMLLFACQAFDISFMAFDIKNKRYEKFISKCRNRPPLVIYNIDGHMYMITDKKVLESLIKSNANTLHAKHKSCVVQIDGTEIEQNLPIYDWVSLDALETIVAPAIVIVQTSDLMDIFKQIIQTHNKLPKVQNKGERTIKSITFEREDGKVVYIQKDANYGQPNIDYKKMQELCKTIDVPFKNQGIGSLITTYFQSYLKSLNARPVIDRELFFKQKGRKCCMCNSTENIQIDHIVRKKDGGGDEIDNLQPLCFGCHFHKSKNEQNNEYMPVNQIMSSFNRKTRKLFENDLMKKIQFTQKISEGTPRFAYDLAKCRKNCMYYSEYKFPVFSVLDDVEIFDGKLKCGFYFCKSDNTFPLRGNGWYSQPMVEYCIKNKIDIKITHQFCPAITLPTDYFRVFVDKVYSKFGNIGKLAINSFIGCMYNLGDKRLVNTTNSGVYTRSLDEACYAYSRYNGSFVRFEEDLGLYQILFSRETINDETAAPIYNYILDMEALEAHKLSLIVEDALYVRTDCIQTKNDVDISKFEWAEGVPKYTKKEDTRDEIMELLPNWTRDGDYVDEVKKWSKINEIEDVDELAEVLLSIGSFQMNGRAGCGKSFIIKKLKEKLESGYVCLAPTNKAARNVGGMTLHKFVGKGCCRVTEKLVRNIHTIIVDEISMMAEMFYKVFISIKNIKPEMKFILSGDFAQLKPVRDRADFNYRYSRALYELCNGKRLELTKCKRSDDTLFKMCLNVMDVDKMQFGKNDNLYKNVCYTNKKRKSINKLCMDRFNVGKEFIIVKAFSWDVESQDMMISVGTPLIARMNCVEYDIANNDTFVVTKIENDKIELDDGLEIDVSKIDHLFHVAFCITTHKSQGDTFKCEYTIHEWDKMSEELRYVALSRGTCVENINIF
jgi:hypothetical protein